MDFLNIYLQIAIVFGVLYLVKNLLKTFNRRRITHKRYLDHINGKDEGQYIIQYFDCGNAIEDYLIIILATPFVAVCWPLHILKNI